MLQTSVINAWTTRKLKEQSRISRVSKCAILLQSERVKNERKIIICTYEYLQTKEPKYR